jgi:hypothetical protein
MHCRSSRKHKDALDLLAGHSLSSLLIPLNRRDGFSINDEAYFEQYHIGIGLSQHYPQ